MAKAANAVPAGFYTLTPQLTLDNANQTLDWYIKAFGAEDKGRSLGPDGKIMHAQFKIGNSHFYANDTMPGMKGPKDYGGSPSSLWLYVENSDELFKRAVAAGATVQVPIDDQFWGDRAGCVGDPEGYSWWIATRKEDLTEEEMMARAAEVFKQMAPPTA